MNALNAILIAVVLLSTTLLAQEKPKLPSRDEVLKAVEVFIKAPVSAQARDAAATITTFAQKSDDVTIVVSMKAVPWFERDKPPKFSGTLLAAFLAGNIKSQLERRTNADDSYAGVQQVLKTYSQLKEADKTLDIPEVQKLADLEAKKQLKKYLDNVVKAEEKKPAK